MNSSTQPQEYTFQAEIQQLLKLLSHSLYQNKEIAIRELVSNASDALDKFRHVGLENEEHRDDGELKINIEANADDKLLVIRDNGIGMTEEELVKNLGTIAHSGSSAFLNNLSGDEKTDVSLIGQFGVGFYSAFMLSDTVEVLTRSYKEETGWKWTSDGTGAFTIEPADDLERGTQIRLQLKKDVEDFAQETRIKHIVTQYSTFVPYPIYIGEEHVNNQPPIWVEPKSQLKQEQYDQFYQYLSHRPDESPLWHLHLSSDSPFQFHSILYCPQSNYEKMGWGRIEHGLHMCAKRILVDNDCRDLLPEYLRFIYGLVDSADLPLNVSRESLQDNTVFRKIRKVLVKRVLDMLAKMAKDDHEKYANFYEQFGSVLREGISTDFEYRDKIAKLLRFESSHTKEGGDLTSLDAYLERCADEQKQIYYVGGSDRANIEKNPNLEIFRKKELEVLYLTDPVDEFMLNQLNQFEEHQLVAIDDSRVEFPGDKPADEKADDSDDEKAEEKKADPTVETPAFTRVLELFREALGDQVTEVRASERLTESPCCLVNPGGAMSAQLQKAMAMANQGMEMPKRILEVNPKSPLIEQLGSLSSDDSKQDFVRNCGQQLFANAMLLEGLTPSSENMVDRIYGFMEQLAESHGSQADSE